MQWIPIIIVTGMGAFMLSQNKIESYDNDDDQSKSNSDDKVSEMNQETKLSTSTEYKKRRDFDTLEDLKKKLTSSEFIKYMAANYDLIYDQYVKTKKLNRIISFTLIIVLFLYGLTVSILIWYYNSKLAKESDEGKMKSSNPEEMKSELIIPERDRKRLKHFKKHKKKMKKREAIFHDRIKGSV